MKNRERFVRVLNFQKVDDRLPMIEWADWWEKTLERWREEGLPTELGGGELREYFGLDMLRQFWIRPFQPDYYRLRQKYGDVKGEEDYKRIKEYLFPEDPLEPFREALLSYKQLHEDGEMVIWMTLNGFFWHPRDLFGIEGHFYAFYDYPELMHQINQDLTEYHIRVVEEFCKILKPDFMTFAEDMSYNHGPMLSYDLFREFLLPYYKQIVPVLKKHGIIPFVDTDGNLEEMIPWLLEAGIEGVLPLERQSGVDVVRIRENYPHLKMIGGYDKMVMNRGEEAMRREFERLLPVMKSGGFIPSCDHQTPPAVSLEDYHLYLQLYREYVEKAVRE